MNWNYEGLGELIKPVKEQATILPDVIYRQITVRLFNKGVTERGKILGQDIGSKQYIAREGQFIISKIDARNGAFGLVTKELDGAVVTGDFLLFDCKESLLPEFLYYVATTAAFVDECIKASAGSTNRVRLKPYKFLQIKIPIGTPTEQRFLIIAVS